ncbi:MAG: hypothetical protein ACRDGI_09870 [Candidatus Limnocylindrales bacterium]
MEQPYVQTARTPGRWLPGRAGLLIAAVVAAQLSDLATFVPAVARVGIGAESNPLARSLYLLQGPAGPALLKAAAIAVMLLALLRVERRFPTLVLPSAVVLVAIGLVGAASNLLFGLAA